MKRISHLKIDNLVKGFCLVFILINILWAVTSFLAFGDIYLFKGVLIANLIISIILTFLFYMYRFHTILSYDDEKFELKRGRSSVQDMWRSFSLVSLVHLGHGRFAVRLYKAGVRGQGLGVREQESEIIKQKSEDTNPYSLIPNPSIIDIPASELKLDPFEFRFEVMNLIQGSKRKIQN